MKYATIALLVLLFYTFMDIKAWDLTGILLLLIASFWFDWSMRK